MFAPLDFTVYRHQVGMKIGASMSDPLVSILINNYNYGRFLADAIDSALRQDYPNVEVVVVDDGSNDHSREIILSYGDLIKPVLKSNGGQASAFNAGVATSRGDLICFLDADDVFYPAKVSTIAERFLRNGLNSKPMMIHHLANLKDAAGDDIEGFEGRLHESPMNLLSFAKRHRFMWYEGGPTSTLTVNRALAQLLFPIPEAGMHTSADDFVVFGAFLFADVYSIADKLGGYRLHGKNYWASSDKQKSSEHLHVIQCYLNDKLAENRMDVVIDWKNSIYAWHGLRDKGHWLQLSARMAKVFLRDRDRYTALFVYHNIMMIGMQLKKTLLLSVSARRARADR
jgi:glycosyltransferase involved in cell wall biosynthesis